jgi:hypothetical protein
MFFWNVRNLFGMIHVFSSNAKNGIILIFGILSHKTENKEIWNTVLSQLLKTQKQVTH